MWQKLKTNKAMAKRIKVSKNNKFKHEKAYVSHLLTNKDKAQKQSKFGRIISDSEYKRVKTLIPYKLR